MQKQILFLPLSLLISVKVYSQVAFEKGYFIDELNQKTECLIKNVDWRDNPTEFRYKLAQDSPVYKASIQTIRAFGIDSVSKFIRATVAIDRSGDKISDLSTRRNPVFVEEQLFLRVLVEGEASLFTYVSGNLTRFFYQRAGGEINQLVYRQYLVDNKVAHNTYYKQQLFADLQCPEMTMRDIEEIAYQRSDLRRFFVSYNQCSNSTFTDYEQTQKTDLFNLSFRPGLSSRNLRIDNAVSNSRDTDFGHKFNVRFGIETEFILPSNKNKWSVILEPTYQRYHSESYQETETISEGIIVTSVNYQSIELPAGLRYYAYLNDDSKIFANLSYVLDFSFNSSIEFLRNDGVMLDQLEIKSRGNLAFGLGFKFRDRYGVEVRYITNREMLHKYSQWNTDFRTLSVIFGYSVF